jgi:hypothetical protein
MEFFFFYFVETFLNRGRVCNLLLLLVLASAVPLGSALSDERSGLSFGRFEFQFDFILRPTVSRPVRLGIGHPFGTLGQILSCSSFFG